MSHPPDVVVGHPPVPLGELLVHPFHLLAIEVVRAEQGEEVGAGEVAPVEVPLLRTPHQLLLRHQGLGAGALQDRAGLPAKSTDGRPLFCGLTNCAIVNCHIRT